MSDKEEKWKKQVRADSARHRSSGEAYMLGRGHFASHEDAQVMGRKVCGSVFRSGWPSPVQPAREETLLSQTSPGYLPSPPLQ